MLQPMLLTTLYPKNHSVKRLFKTLFITMMVVVLHTCAFAETVLVTENELKPTADHQRTTNIVTRLLSNYHYKTIPLDDTFSVRIMDRFIESLDPMHMYFTIEDIKLIEQQRNMFDDYLKAANLLPFFDIFKTYRRNLLRQTEFALELVELEFDFTIDESLELDRKDMPRTANNTDLNELWRKRIKNEYLNIKLAGKKNPKEKACFNPENDSAEDTQKTSPIWSNFTDST